MTRLRPVVVPVAALALATAAPSALAQQRRPVVDRADSPSAQSLAAQLADLPTQTPQVQPATTSLPLAVLATASEAAAPDDRYASAPSPAGAGAAGRPAAPTARGPPS
jgi:hypothetical protein